MSCPHLPSVWVELGPIIEQSKKCRQVTCQATTNLWICIHPSCGFVACGRTIAGHAETHSKQKKHDLCMNISTGVIWCYVCDTEVIERERAPNEYKAKLRAFRALIHPEQPLPTLTSNSSSTSSSSAGTGSGTTSSSITLGNQQQQILASYFNCTLPGTPTPTALLSRTDTDWSNYISPSYPLGSLSTNTTTSPTIAGLVGLANLGNTCFLNAALQALSNVTPLSLYFTEIPFSSTRPEREQQLQQQQQRNPSNNSDNQIGGLSAPLRQLYLSLWDNMPRQPVAFGYNAPFYKPSSILNNLRKVNPLFEGYNQQDAHEALRTILNDVHEKCMIDIPIGLYNNNFPAPAYTMKQSIINNNNSTITTGTGLTENNTKENSSSSSSATTNETNANNNDIILSKRSKKNEGLQLRELRDRNSSTISNSSRSLKVSSVTNDNHKDDDDSDDSHDGTRVPRSATTKQTGTTDKPNISTSSSTTNNQRSWLHDGPYTGPDTVQRSVISDLFQGLFCSRVRCSICKTESLTYETFWDLSLSIPDRPHPVAGGTDGSVVPPEARQWAAETETDFDDTPLFNHHGYDNLAEMSPLSAAAAALSTDTGSGAYYIDNHGNIVINQEPILSQNENDSSVSGNSKTNSMLRSSPVVANRNQRTGSYSPSQSTDSQNENINTVVVSNAMRKALSTENNDHTNISVPNENTDAGSGSGLTNSNNKNTTSNSSTTWDSIGKVLSSVFCSFRDFLPLNPESFGHIGRGDHAVGMGDCLYNFFEWDALVKANQYFCEKCKMKVDAERRISIAALPEVLCIHLKRFSYHNWGSKNSTAINYPLTGLDLSPFLSHGAHSQAIKSYIRAKEQQVGRKLIINNSSGSTMGESHSSNNFSTSVSSTSAASTEGNTDTVNSTSGLTGNDKSSSSTWNKKRTTSTNTTNTTNNRSKTNKSNTTNTSTTNPGKKRVISEMNPEARAIVLHRHSLATGTTGMEEISAAITSLTTVGSNSSPSSTNSTESNADASLEPPVISSSILSATGIPLPSVITSNNKVGNNPNIAMATLASLAAQHRYPLAFWCAYLLPRPAPWLGPLVGPYPVPQARRISPASLGDAKYDLVSVVQHLGGIHGGHYIAHAKNRFDNRWYTFDDASVTPLDTNSVTKKEGYILFYQRQRPTTGPLAPVVLPPRDSNDTSYIYISRYWWLRYKTLACPGPISNADILCDHGAVKNDLSEKINQLTIALTTRQYELLAQAYGSSEPPLKEVTLCSECREEAKALANRRKREQEKITKVDTTSLPSGEEAWYLMSEVWLSRWRHFIRNEGYTDGTGRGILPPGPIDNARLLGKNGQPLPNLQPITHYRGVNANVWNFLVKIYGGGPPLRRKTIDIYSHDVTNDTSTTTNSDTNSPPESNTTES